MFLGIPRMLNSKDNHRKAEYSVELLSMIFLSFPFFKP